MTLRVAIQVHILTNFLWVISTLKSYDELLHVIAG